MLCDFVVCFFWCVYLDELKHYRSKQYIPDFGVFLMYMTLWENNECEFDFQWKEICKELLDEIFCRQVKWVLNKHAEMIEYHHNHNNDWNEKRLSLTWKETLVSRRLFMFQTFFLKDVCGLFSCDGDNKKQSTPQSKFEEYNENFGLCRDKSLPLKLQNYVKKIYQTETFSQFFSMIDINYPGDFNLSKWLLGCMYQSKNRMYHKPYLYFEKIKRYEQQINNRRKVYNRQHISDLNDNW